MTTNAIIFRALVLRPILREKLRSILTLAGVAVGVAVLVAIQLSNQSALRAFQESVDAVSGRANFQIVSEAAMLDEALLLKLQPIWKSGGRFAPVIDLEGSLASGLPVRILAVDLLSDLHFRDYRYARIAVVDGSPASAGELIPYLQLFKPDSAIVPAVFATEHGLRIGSPLMVESENRRVQLVVRGILQPTGPATAFNGSLIILDIATAQQAFGLIGKVSRIDLLVPENRSGALTAALEKSLPENVRLERPRRRNERVQKMLRAFRINLFALASVALLVGMFLVYNTVLISVLRRRRDVGLLKTLGTSPRQIFSAFLGEAVVLGVLGSALGVGLGYVIAASTLDLVGRTINALYVTSAPDTIVVTPLVVLIAMFGGTLVSVLAALQPALEAAAVRPSALIRPGLYQRLGRTKIRSLLVLAALTLTGAALTSRLPAFQNLPIGGYVSVALVVAGFSLLAPAVLLGLSRLLRPLLERVFSVSGTLASGSLDASLRRVAVATAALALSIGMMVAIAMMIGSFRETVSIWVAQTVQSDLWLRPGRTLSNSPTAVFPESISEALREMDFIESFDRFRGRDMVFEESIIAVGSGDFDVSIARGDLPMVTPRSAKQALSRAVATNGVLVSESFATKFSRKVGDRVKLPTAKGVATFPITGVYRDYSNDRGVIVMDRALYVAQFGDTNINTIALFLKKGVDAEWARKELEKRLGRKYRAFAMTNGEIRAQVMKIFDQTFKITYALLAVALIVAVLGIVNTMSALILERRHELALIRVLGVTRWEVARMIVLESALIGGSSTLIGLASGTVLALLLIFVINRQSFGWTIAYDPPLLVVFGSVALTFLATVASGLLPARVAASTAMAIELKAE